MNSHRVKREGDTDASVEWTAPYADPLQNRLDRVIVSEQDEREGEDALDKSTEAVIKKFI